jgi:hypothetical protein
VGVEGGEMKRFALNIITMALFAFIGALLAFSV